MVIEAPLFAHGVLVGGPELLRRGLFLFYYGIHSRVQHYTFQSAWCSEPRIQKKKKSPFSIFYKFSIFSPFSPFHLFNFQRSPLSVQRSAFNLQPSAIE